MIASKQTSSQLASGYPPWHAIAFMGGLLAVSIACLPSIQDLDQIAVVDTFTHRTFPELVSVKSLAWIRLAIAVTIWLVTLHTIFINPGWDIHTTYRPYSKLKNTVYPVSGFKTLCMFTSWCWVMLGLSFSLNGYIALAKDLGMDDTISPWILRLALIAWELCSPFSLLVSAVVRYAIWPAMEATGRPHKLGCFRNQMQHNMNSVFALLEMALLGHLPVYFSHMSFPCLVGVIYVFFSWSRCHAYGKPGEGPQYIYWFLDTTLGKETTIALAALLTTLAASFAVFATIELFVEWTGPSLFTHIMSLVLVTSVVIRVK